MSHLPAESPQVGAVAGVEEDSGEGEADREAHPYSVDAETCLEAKKVGGRDGDEVVADKSGVHNRPDILDATQDVGEAELETVAELVGEEQEEKRHSHRRDLRGVCEYSGGLVAEAVQQHRQRGGDAEGHEVTFAGIFTDRP